jgi:hypothetical protein
MAGIKSAYWSNIILDYLYGSGSPATIYFGLYTVAPSAGGGGTEATITRVGLTNNATNFPAAASQLKQVATIVDFGTIVGDKGDIIGMATHDAISGGHFMHYGPFTTTRTLRDGDTFAIAANAGGIQEL